MLVHILYWGGVIVVVCGATLTQLWVVFLGISMMAFGLWFYDKKFKKGP